MKNTDTYQLDGPLGPMILAATEQGLSGAWFQGQRHAPSSECMQHWTPNAQNPLLARAAAQLKAYFSGQLARFELPLDLSAGTLFQQSVWHALLTVPAHQTRSYGDLAKQLNRPKAARAVGSAVGRNPLAIIVPCHRILASNGGLTGYAGGLWRKKALLEIDRQKTA